MNSSELEGLRRAVCALAGTGALSQPERGDWVADRVGRNEVWKLTPRSSPGAPRFAKIYPSPLDYRRELRGLQVARGMAEGRDWLMAADVLIADERGRFLVTDALPGTSLRELVRTALRLGVPWRRRAVALEQASRCLELIVDWVDLLQVQPPGPVEDLQDDRPPAVARRVAEKRARLRRGGPGAASAAPGPCGAEVLTHGDLSFGNVFYHEGRVGVVDFENLGIGPRFRDILWIRYGLEQCNFRWYYRDSTPLIGLLDAPDPDDWAAGLHRMEFVVDHLLILEARLAARPWSERVLGLSERWWALREYRRLGRLLASG